MTLHQLDDLQSSMMMMMKLIEEDADDDDGREEGESSPKFELVQCGVHGGGESGTCPCRHQCNNR